MSRLEDYVDNLPEWKKIYHGKYRTELVTRISEILEEKDWNQSDLADELDCSDAYVSKLLSGNANITLKTVSKLEAALNEDVMHIAWSIGSKYEEDFFGVNFLPLDPEEEFEEEISSSKEAVVGFRKGYSVGGGLVVQFGASGIEKRRMDANEFGKMEVKRGSSTDEHTVSLS